MPPWGRPPGGRAGVGRFMEEVEDVYRFQDFDSDDEKNGVYLDPAFQKVPSGNHFNPDELYFNDMDFRAWERRSAEIGYADDLDYYPEDEGYYEDGDAILYAAEYDEMLFHRVLDKIRVARATGEPDVQLSPEELEAYQNRLYARSRAPAARPPRARPVTEPIQPMLSAIPNNAIVGTAEASSSSHSGSSRSKKRTSFFGSRSKKEKPSSRRRAPSNVSDTTIQSIQPPGFLIPGPSGQPMYAPVNSFPPRIARASPVRSASSPSRPGSRSASLNSRHAQTPPRATPPRDLPGTFPSGSPHRYRDGTPPPRQGRPPSSSSRRSTQDSMDSPHRSRSRSSSLQQGTRLVPFPVVDYQHYTAEPYQYHVPGQSSSSAQPQYARRVVSGPVDGNYTTMPRRVPVPVQRAAAPMPSTQGSAPDPALAQNIAPTKTEGSDEDDGQSGVVVVDVPQTDEKGSKAQTGKSAKESSSSGSKDGKDGKDGKERRRSERSSKRK